MTILRFLKTLCLGKSRLKRLRHAIRVTLGSPAKSNISLERIQIPDKDISVAAERYLANLHLAQAWAEMNGAAYLNFLQPFNGHGRKNLTAFDVRSVAHIRRDVDAQGENQLDLIIRFMDELWQKMENLESCHDLRAMFEDHEGDVYLDHVHVSDIGQDLIARRISEIIQAMEHGQSRAQ